jgi:membrane protease YdiL (CAAX protease family)
VSFLAAQHLGALVFFAVLLLLERVRRAPALAPVRHPLYAYLARAALVAAYFALAGLDPTAWFVRDAGPALALGVALALAVGIVRRRDVVTLARGDPAMALQAGYLAAFAALVEELIFRGAFVLVAAVTPLAAALATVGSSVAYLVWRAVAYRERDARSVALVFAFAAALALVTEATGSLWPAVLAHASYILLAGPPRPRTTRARSRATPSADRP